jgi:hypothetical protein
MESKKERDTWHAVTAVGFRCGRTPILQPGEVYDLAGDMVALYIHDDRIGPYQRVNPFTHTDGALGLRSHRSSDDEEWLVRYVLVPLHAKIRISVSALRELATETITHVLNAHGTPASDTKLAIAFEAWISRPINYLQDLCAFGNRSGGELASVLTERLSMPRYLGIIRLSGPTIGIVDVLIDTTSTMKNLNFVAVGHHGESHDRKSLEIIASSYRCDLFAPTALGAK